MKRKVLPCPVARYRNAPTPTYTIKAQPTIYSGVVFRSQLEAQWASMFNYLGWSWQYEPFCIGKTWLPDFIIRNHLGRSSSFDILIEIKPNCEHVTDANNKIRLAFEKGKTWWPYLILGSNCDLLYHEEHIQPWHDEACFIDCKLQASRNWNRALLRIKQQN